MFSQSSRSLSTPPANERLELVRESPAKVKAHDEQGWLDLFARDAQIEDPVGAGVHTKADGEARAFYDTFIAPNNIEFKVKQDIVAGNEVARDVVIETRSSSGMKIDVPAHLRYTLTNEDGQLRLASLRAHWELRETLGQTLANGLPGIQTLMGTAVRMLKNQGLQGALAYSKGMFNGIFHRGNKQASKVMNAIGNGNVKALRSLFHDDAERIELLPGQLLTPGQLLEAVGKLERVEMGECISSGWSTSFSYRMSGTNGSWEGMAFLDFEPSSKKIRCARFMVNELLES